MAGLNGNTPLEIDVDPAVFQNFADLEKEFAKVELDALRRKEFALRPLYEKRNVLSSQIPNFWPSVLLNGPHEFQALIGETWVEAAACIKSLNIERYQIKSETEGEPRSLRFTFEFHENELFEDTKIVKEFEFVQYDEDGSGDLVSRPVTFKWKKKGKKISDGLLDAVVELYKAEEVVRLKDGKSGEDLEVVDREGLWQYEKLMEKMDKVEAEQDENEPCWLDWFGFRGAIGREAKEDKKEKVENGEGEDEDEDSDGEDDDGMLNVEIFPGGEEVAIALAEDLWPNVMDYFMASQQEPLDDEDDFEGLDSDEVPGDDEEAPELVEAVQDPRPAKRQKRA